MASDKLHLYSIVPLDTEHLEEICEDIRYQYENGVSTCPLFCMTLSPEGDPVTDKAAILAEKYRLFRARLQEMGVPSGILVQATIGHGYQPGKPAPFQRYTNFNDGRQTYTVCPLDEDFRAYIRRAMTTIAREKPDCIMVDDDFRLMNRPGKGCACPLHMKRYSRLSGEEIGRQQLWDSVSSGSEEGKRRSAFMAEAQKQSLLETAKIMREGIDEVDPSLPGSFCACCTTESTEFGEDIAAILAGKGNPVVIRVNNGNYTPAGARLATNAFHRAASQIAKMKDKADVLLAETDTCPQNRYSTSAYSLHTHFTGTLLEGAAGAKHWITRLAAFEPESGKAYRRILSRYRGFYEALAEIVPTLRWRGCRIPVSAASVYRFDAQNGYAGDNAWASCVLERLGLPMYFSAEDGGVLCLEGNADVLLTDEEIKAALARGAMLSSDAAAHLIRRGFGEYLGVDVREWTGKTPSTETLHINGNKTGRQMCMKELVITDPAAEADSTVSHTVDQKNYEPLFPGSVICKNASGGTVFTFCGSPRAKFHYTEAFSFLNYSRKQQLIRMLTQAGELPAYYPGDEEMYFRAADMPDGGLFCALFNIGLDPIEELSVCAERDVAKIERLLSDGSRKEVDFRRDGDRYVTDISCCTLEPVILFLS